jgi:hypothetical protein
MPEVSTTQFELLKLILVLVTVFSTLWVLKFIINNAPIRKNIKSRITRAAPSIEAIIWLAFIIWSIRHLIQNDIWNSIGVMVVMLMVLILLSWFVLRDYLAGVVIKSDGSMRLNDRIRVRNVEGRITSMGLRSMIITADSGETVNMPYSAISGEISSKPNPSEDLISNTFNITIARHFDAAFTFNHIRKSLLNAPWSSVRKFPEIKLIKDSGDIFQFEITVYSIKVVYFQKIKEHLKQSMISMGHRFIE